MGWTDRLRRTRSFERLERLELEDTGIALPEGDIVDVSGDHSGRLVIATSRADPEATYAGRQVSPGWASFPDSAASEPYTVHVSILDAGRDATSVEVNELPVAYPRFQPLPDGEIIAVGARTRYSDSGAERNAVIIDASGEQVSSFCIGDGVASVQTTRSGQIWAGYNDEGVFGNYGWGTPNGPTPLGRSGLACWNTSGQQIYEFQPPDDHSPIADCYALNLVGEDAWACYYTDFPIVRVSEDRRVTLWLGEVAGPHALVVASPERVGLLGGYQGLFDRLVWVDLLDGVAPVHRTVQLVAPGGDELPGETLLVARGQFVHAVAHGKWLRLDAADLAP